MVLRGHEDLQPKAIVGFDMGYALVDCAGEVKRYRMTIGPGGHLAAEPAPEPQNTGPDQLGVPDPDLRARRHIGVDQL